MNTWIKTTLAFLLSCAVAASGYVYWQYSQTHPSTDDAYVSAHRINIAAEVSGRITHVYVSDNQPVVLGQPLFDIDARAYELSKDKLKAQVELTESQTHGAQDAVKVARSNVAEAQAIYLRAQKNNRRISTLAREGKVSRAQADDAKTNLQVAKTKLAGAHSQLRQSQQKLGKLGKQNAQYRIAIADLALAHLILEHAHVTAPANGIVTQVTSRAGDMVSAGAPLFALIEQNHWWIDANFKETQLTHLRNHQNAEITLDMYPGKTFIGTIESISPSSGNTFSLLPNENASGNWVKVTQRFPVKIRIKDNDAKHPLRIGASAHVVVDTSKK